MTVRNHLVIIKREEQEDSSYELTEAQVYQWLKNGSLQDGDIVYEIINRKVVRKPDMVLEPA